MASAPTPGSESSASAALEVAAPDLAGSDVVLIEVGREEINQWKRGFTPQAEIWNGRMAMLGLSIGLGSLLLVRLIGDIGGAH
ncbi:high light inducible protein [Vulcanococcus limneticus]|jgi:hypothetical protein|uniref:high light inducible protein n=1 Tax=Vulcanococcus limneticus TaxID=2170428 RepID=UPI00398BC31E